MKQRLNLIDIIAIVNEFQKLVNMRVSNIYDGSESKIHFIKLNYQGNKQLLFIESGIRIHTTSLDFKVFRDFPSSFSSKLRKHLKNKRIVEIKQIGNDRIIQFQFGEGDFTNYLICEFYSSGNIILTDHEYKILAQGRQHIYNEDNKKVYPIKYFEEQESQIDNIINKLYLKENKHLESKEDYDTNLVLDSIKQTPGGYIIKDSKGKYQDVTPYLFNKELDSNLFEIFESLDSAIDIYFQKINPSKVIHKISCKQEKKQKQNNKLDRKEGHLERQALGLEKKVNKQLDKASFIEENYALFEELITKARYYFENRYKIHEIKADMLENTPDIVISKIDYKDKTFTYNKIDINFTQSVYDNIAYYHSLKKHAKVKHERAVEILEKEQQTTKKKTKHIELKPSIVIVPKTYWFEQYHWFISSDGFIVICGRNAEQNEQICKKYLEKNDMYVHADFHGSGSCVVKSNNKPIPIKTLEQAGAFVLCFSKAWTSNISDRSYYVTADQVSKTAPSGEYLTTGSMMVRGKKNYMSLSILELSVCIIFKTQGSDSFKFSLNKDDIVTESKAMIAPPKAVINAQYKVKLVPGAGKRNKTLESVITKLRQVKPIDSERDYVLNIKKTDLDSLVPQKSKKV